MSMQVTNRFQALQYLKKLPNDFTTVKVDVESLKDKSLRRLCRDLEKQLKVEQANLNYDREVYEEYLKKLLDDERMDTRDIRISLVVLGNKQGFLSGRIFNQADYHKRTIDVGQFDDDYPIFIDTSTTSFLETGKTIQQMKRERDQTFSQDPDTKQIRVETISDLQTALAEQEIDFKKQVDDWKAKYYSAEENNQHLIQAATQNENALVSQVNELRQINEAANQNQKYLTDQVNALQSKVQNLEVTRMEEDHNQQDDELINNEIDALRQVNEDLRSKIEEISNKPQANPPRIFGLFDDLYKELNSGDIAERTAAEEAVKNQLDEKFERMTLSQMGIPTWNEKTTAFLDYLMSLRSIFFHHNLTHKRAIHLLFSSLPSKYSYVRTAIRNHPDYLPNDGNNYGVIERIVVEMIMGSKDRIFSAFMNLQKTKSENFIQYYTKVIDFYLFTQTNSYRSEIEKDPMAFKLVKEKMVKAIPNQLVPEFKRRLEGKDKWSDIFKAILDMQDQFPNTENDDYNETNIYVLKQQRRPDWHKNAKCFHCGRKGHIKKNCYKREAKTKKSGISGKDKKSQK